MEFTFPQKLWWLEKLNVKQVLVGASRSAEKPYVMFAFIAGSVAAITQQHY